jgi:hypothetical protein
MQSTVSLGRCQQRRADVQNRATDDLRHARIMPEPSTGGALPLGRRKNQPERSEI